MKGVFYRKTFKLHLVFSPKLGNETYSLFAKLWRSHVHFIFAKSIEHTSRVIQQQMVADQWSDDSIFDKLTIYAVSHTVLYPRPLHLHTVCTCRAPLLYKINGPYIHGQWLTRTRCKLAWTCSVHEICRHLKWTDTRRLGRLLSTSISVITTSFNGNGFPSVVAKVSYYNEYWLLYKMRATAWLLCSPLLG